MTRQISATALAAMFAQETGEVPLVCLTIAHPDLVTPIRVVNDKQTLIRGGGALGKDASGPGRDLALTNGPAWVQGILGATALSFNGVDQYGVGTLTVSGVEGAIEFWTKGARQGSGAGSRIVRSNANVRTYFTINAAGDQITFEKGDPSVTIGAAAIDPDNPVHLGMSWWTDAGQLKAEGFVNGVKVVGPTNFSTNTNGTYVSVAAFSNIGQSFTTGVRDDIRVWSVRRTEEQIRTYMGERLRGNEPGLEAYWPLDDGGFLPFPFEIVLPDDLEDAQPRTRVRFDNVDRSIVDAVRGLETSPTVTIEVVLASTPSVIEAGPFVMTLKSLTYDALTVEGELGYEDMLDEPFPRDTFTPNNSPGLF